MSPEHIADTLSYVFHTLVLGYFWKIGEQADVVSCSIPEMLQLSEAAGRAHGSMPLFYLTQPRFPDDPECMPASACSIPEMLQLAEAAGHGDHAHVTAGRIVAAVASDDEPAALEAWNDSQVRSSRTCQYCFEDRAQYCFEDRALERHRRRRCRQW